MGFQTREVLSFFSKHFKQNTNFFYFEIYLFFRCFATIEFQRGIVDH
jgi:hypothetical protein